MSDKPNYRKMCRQIAKMANLRLAEYYGDNRFSYIYKCCGFYNSYIPIIVVDPAPFKNPNKEVYPAIIDKYRNFPNTNEWDIIDIINSKLWREGLSSMRDTYVESSSNEELQVKLDATVGDV